MSGILGSHIAGQLNCALSLVLIMEFLSKGLPSQPSQTNKPVQSPCEVTKHIGTTEVKHHKTKMPRKSRRLKPGTSKNEMEEKDAVSESQGLPSMASQTNKPGTSPSEMNKPIKTAKVELHKAEKPWKPSCLKSSTTIETQDMSIKTTEVGLHKAKNPWKPRRQKSSDKELKDLYKKTLSILNKLTLHKFQVLVSRMKTLKIDTKDKLKGVVDLVFEKAICEPYFSEVYANMCKCLSKLRVKSDWKTVTFRDLLSERCRIEFKTKYHQIPVLSSNARKSPKCKDDSRTEKANEEVKAKHRSLGNVRFMGELFKLKIISQNIMHDCVFKLLRAKDPESLASVCRLLTTIGKELDTVKNKPRMDQHFQQMAKLANDKKNTARVRFMIEDVISVRLNKWIPQCSNKTPQTIDQIHLEVARERHVEKLQKSQKGALGNSEEDFCLRNPGTRHALGNRRGRGGFESPRNFSARRLQKQESEKAAANLSALGRSEEECGQRIPVTHLTRGKGRDGGGFARTKIIQGHTEAAQCFVEKGPDNTKDVNSTPATRTNCLTLTEIADRLHDIIVVRQEDNETVFNWIESNVEHATTAKSQFIRELMIAVCQSAITGEKGNEKLVPKNISRRSNLLQKYLNHKALFELQALFAQQMLVSGLERQHGLLRGYFDIFYDEDIITEDVFSESEEGENEPEGKTTALEQVVQFLEWLKEARADS
ncbi:eukaryotic translation initiation factor 4 gamma 1-like isoform X1 [Mya arenaria]|uniref:eukaryotic translation initiation factor 4 gamma 1-like isoform X1 n=2 Tax=Mya arenaria TaxID=6604 RepID=UPI0022E23BEF|nr:eukaryotic translation initiation factor 4 gamma 1-like isoform X1 [Mya arenaria]